MDERTKKRLTDFVDSLDLDALNKRLQNIEYDPEALQYTRNLKAYIREREAWTPEVEEMMRMRYKG